MIINNLSFLIKTLSVSFLLLGFVCNEEKATQKEASKNSIVEKREAGAEKVSEIPLPAGFVRIKNKAGTFGEYLGSIALKKSNTVYLYNGELKGNQKAQYAVLDISVGDRDLQQCADAVMRLRAEYLKSAGRQKDIHFNNQSGKPMKWDGKQKWQSYLNYVFSYANTRSLKAEMKSVAFSEMQTGDVLIVSGNPYGHAITVMDMAENDKGEKIYLLAQSYMPAQDIHILKNPENDQYSPWYSLADEDGVIETPEWTFSSSDLKRF